MVAVKRIRLEGLSEDDVKQLMQEVDMRTNVDSRWALSEEKE